MIVKKLITLLLTVTFALAVSAAWAKPAIQDLGFCQVQQDSIFADEEKKDGEKQEGEEEPDCE